MMSSCFINKQPVTGIRELYAGHSISRIVSYFVSRGLVSHAHDDDDDDERSDDGKDQAVRY